MIDFTFTEEQDLFRKAAREFAETQIAPLVPAMEENEEDWDPAVKAICDAEMLAITIPEEYGGLGLGYVERLIALEEIARFKHMLPLGYEFFALVARRKSVRQAVAGY